jgi:hypothetical protein
MGCGVRFSLNNDLCSNNDGNGFSLEVTRNFIVEGGNGRERKEGAIQTPLKRQAPQEKVS